MPGTHQGRVCPLENLLRVPLIEIDNGGLGIRADLAGGGAERVGSLLGMPAPHPPMAMATASLVNAEFSAYRLDGDLFLELLIDFVILHDAAAAMRTAIGQRRFEDFVELHVDWPGSMATLAVSSTTGPGGGFGIRIGLALGERRGLALAGPLSHFELGLETIAVGVETGVALLQFGNALIALNASRADQRGHKVSVAKPAAASCANFITIC